MQSTLFATIPHLLKLRLIQQLNWAGSAYLEALHGFYALLAEQQPESYQQVRRWSQERPHWQPLVPSLEAFEQIPAETRMALGLAAAERLPEQILLVYADTGYRQRKGRNAAWGAVLPLQQHSWSGQFRASDLVSAEVTGLQQLCQRLRPLLTGVTAGRLYLDHQGTVELLNAALEAGEPFETLQTRRYQGLLPVAQCLLEGGFDLAWVSRQNRWLAAADRLTLELLGPRTGSSDGASDWGTPDQRLF